jgi:hypothetical protein
MKYQNITTYLLTYFKTYPINLKNIFINAQINEWWVNKYLEKTNLILWNAYFTYAKIKKMTKSNLTIIFQKLKEM